MGTARRAAAIGTIATGGLAMSIDTLTHDAVIRLAVIAGERRLDEERIRLVLDAAQQLAGRSRAIALTALSAHAERGNAVAARALALMEDRSGTVHDYMIDEACAALWPAPAEGGTA
jgi:hypothetical protein